VWCDFTGESDTFELILASSRNPSKGRVVIIQFIQSPELVQRFSEWLDKKKEFLQHQILNP
jgi:hypothetical protein